MSGHHGEARPAGRIAELQVSRAALARLGAWSVLVGAPVFASGLLVAAAVDDFIGGSLRRGLAWLLVYAVLAFVGATGTRHLYSGIAGIVEPVRDRLIGGLTTAALQRSMQASRRPTADVARLTSQVEMVRESLAAVLLSGQEFVVVTVSALIGLATLDPLLLAVVLPPLLLAVGLFAVCARRMAATQQSVMLTEERVAEAIDEVGRGLRDIRASGGEAATEASAGARIDTNASATRAMGRLTGLATATIALGTWLPLLCLLLLGHSLMHRGVSAGALLGAATYVMQGLQPALEALVHGAGGPGLWLRQSWRRVQAASTQTPPRTGVVSPGSRGRVARSDGGAGAAVQLSAVTFHYAPHAAPVVEDLTLTLHHGDHLAVVGPSGVGKSTLTALMSGMLLPTSGDVFLQGMHTGDATPADLAVRRTLIPQESYLFAGSVRENLLYLNPRATDDAIRSAIETLSAGALVERLGGLSATLEPDELPSGDRQVLCLVRTYLHPASITILDEATSHLDPVTEAAVEAAFARKPSTLVVVAHRMTAALRARSVLVMDRSGVTVDTHEALLHRSPVYRELWNQWDDAGAGQSHRDL